MTALPVAPAMVLAGLGAHLPDEVVTNDDLSKVMDTNDEWITSRTGIRERRRSRPDETSLSLAIEAGKNAIKHHGSTDIDAVVLATTTPDRMCPATAPDVASSIGLGNIMAFDVAAVCSGFVYAAATAQGLIAAGTAQKVLVIGTESISRFLHPEDRSTGIIFGDGAGAAVMRAGEPDEPGVFGRFHLASDGEQADLIRVNGGTSRIPPSETQTATREHFLTMEGREVYRRAIPSMVASSKVALDARGWTVEDIDVLIGHQANVRILNGVARDLGLDPARCFVNIDRVGNTAGASIPIAMTHAHEDGAVKAGDKVLMTAFGGGLTWGSTTLTWPDMPAIS